MFKCSNVLNSTVQMFLIQLFNYSTVPMFLIQPKSILLLLLTAAVPAVREVNVNSPDNSIRFNLSVKNGSPLFSATLNNSLLITPSPLVMSVDGIKVTDGIKIASVKRFSETDTYPVYGLHSTAINRCNGARIALTHTNSGLKYYMDIKVFDSGFGFRFVVPGKDDEERIPGEATEFNVPSGSQVWYHNLRMHYEGEYSRKLIDTVPAGEWAAPPVTFKLPDGRGYGSITEANLSGYAGMALQTSGNKGFTIRLGHEHPVSYPYELRYTREDIERVSKSASVRGTITTPWRVVLAGKELNTLVNSDVITSLCPPPDKKYFPEGLFTPWIRPGRAVWRYLDGGGDNSLRNMKEFSRLAGEMGFEYNILEGFWSRWPDDSVKALVDYSRNMGVGIIVWKHSKELRDPEERQQFLSRLVNLGIAGIKVDFFDHEAKEVIDFYESLFRECAALKLVLILHGANKPTGLQRTWPNVMIYEAVRGMEASRLVDRATHETTLPFTRMLAGPADYSVCHFGERRRNTTWVHQVATAAIYAAPVITYAANPFNLVSNPCAEMIKSIPPVWDQTIVLAPSEIGEIAVYAQRKGSTWFLSVINGAEPKTVKIPLSFLENITYNTLCLKDSQKDTAQVIIEKSKASKNDIISVNLGTGGGYMCRFSPQQP